MQNIFDRWNNWVNSTESSLVNFLTAFSPWLAPLAPAYMTYQHMKDFLHFPLLLAFALALLVEILGFGTVSTFLDFWFYNRRVRAGSKQAPLGLIVFAFAFYLCLILVTNVVIDIAKSFGTPDQLLWATILVRALLALQTIPGATIVAVRTGHRELLKEIKAEKVEKESGKFQESSRKVPNELETSVESSKNVLLDWRKIRPTLSQDDLMNLANLVPDQMRAYSAETGYTYKTISNWRTRARAELGLE